MHATLSSERVGTNLKRLIKESEFRTQEAFAEAKASWRHYLLSNR